MASTHDSYENEPTSGQTPAGKKDKSIDHVLAELRNVLSELQQPQTVEPPPPQPVPDLASPEPEVIRPNPISKIEIPNQPPLDAGVSSDMPSDQEFWNGNVLGWPSGEPQEKMGQENSELSPKLESDANEIPSEDKMPPIPELSVADRIWLDDSMKEPAPQVFSAKPEVPAEISAPEEKSSLGDEYDFPPAPLSPEEIHAPPVSSDKINMDPIVEPFAAMSKFENESDSGEPSDLGEVAPEPSRVVLPDSLKIPIPGTLHQPLSTNNRPAADSTHADHDLEMKGKIVVQIACLFPAGQDALIHQFADKLEAASKNIPGVDGVHVAAMNALEIANKNYGSWKKAASLAGANFLFVFVPKKDKDQVKDVVRSGHQDEIPCRLIFLEHVPLKTLYADVAADLMRRLHVAG
jgi:hypothetical protein